MQSTPKRVLFLCNNTSTIQAVRAAEIIVRGANRDKNSLLRETRSVFPLNWKERPPPRKALRG